MLVRRSVSLVAVFGALVGCRPPAPATVKVYVPREDLGRLSEMSQEGIAEERRVRERRAAEPAVMIPKEDAGPGIRVSE